MIGSETLKISENPHNPYNPCSKPCKSVKICSIRVICVLSFLVYHLSLQAQGVQQKPSEYTTQLVNRLDIIYGSDIHTGIRAYLRKDIFAEAAKLDSLGDELHWKTQKDIQYLLDDNNDWLNNDEKNWSERPILKYFYRTKAHLFETKHKDFEITVDPILNFQVGKMKGEEKHFVNQRGIALRGNIDKKVFFYTDFVETQIRVPDYVKARTLKDKTLPSAGLYKQYKSDIFKIQKNGYDYLDATAYVGVNISKHIGIQLGHGKNFIGNGYRSLLLSENANNYFYLKLNWQFWKFHYQNIFSELLPQSHRAYPGGDGLLPRKYSATHYLSFKPYDNLEFGFFESVIFNRADHFELQYLNPIILYRTVEHLIGSPDNEIAGLTAKWNFLKKFQLHGQIAFDEFKLDELFRNNNGWWANKYGIQIGAKWVNVAKVQNLDLAIEYNQVRPYTYSHRDSLTAYTHNNQALAHPLGANFKEWIFSASYRPTNRWNVQIRTFVIDGGENEKDKNWGANPLLTNQSRVQDYGNIIGQGNQYHRTITTISLGYQIMHNGWLEVNYFGRQNLFETDNVDNTSIISMGFRLNIDRVKYEF